MPEIITTNEMYLVLMRRLGRLHLLMPDDKTSCLESSLCNHFDVHKIEDFQLLACTGAVDYIVQKEYEYGFIFCDRTNLITTDVWQRMLDNTRWKSQHEPAAVSIPQFLNQLWECIKHSDHCVFAKNKEWILSSVQTRCFGSNHYDYDEFDKNQFLKTAICEFMFFAVYGCLIYA